MSTPEPGGEPDPGAFLAETFLAEVDWILARTPDLTPLDAGVLAALHRGLASDTRSFAKLFGVAHALVLRTVADLADGLGLVTLEARDLRTQRTRLALTEAGRQLVPEALGSH
ncbi:hypothetical protein GCM10007301_06490 [Azorhizobium oxalatiphilum]|uniref:Uncharacterized protein n=1 Tax=Azorhizobium oxalatiphilum TaxID=980631 RepID=A0A917F3M1_9HYPH|nr:MarR family winged helix-turn-helix transcriptional regulator [Azorhizobium oxalatiphilum]GGF49922.1 hypothetical protein GCM10007301_06490 [Azorhizobium oxalatiphilum]